MCMLDNHILEEEFVDFVAQILWIHDVASRRRRAHGYIILVRQVQFAIHPRLQDIAHIRARILYGTSVIQLCIYRPVA